MRICNPPDPLWKRGKREEIGKRGRKSGGTSGTKDIKIQGKTKRQNCFPPLLKGDQGGLEYGKYSNTY